MGRVAVVGGAGDHGVSVDRRDEAGNVEQALRVVAGTVAGRVVAGGDVVEHLGDEPGGTGVELAGVLAVLPDPDEHVQRVADAFDERVADPLADVRLGLVAGESR
ncbi:hypothetical protein E1161_04310 [Saccharopolyspora aridisoli]|uniref:Uncharacterized protein n=1 Tax=Saccharopolyspora aridisoli TaxID=2530385 RepID=A0A4R4V1E0_9PSEU|nr:hypothetical protein [Saccharopolyspora aridisoli]TDC95414.1 hypothetical protein E1161_04310 [Saccharopolyspora aridisoli]